MNSYILIVVTQILGVAQGPIVSMQVLPNAAQCDIARKAVLAAVDEATSTLAGANKSKDGMSGFGRRVATARCEALSSTTGSR